MKLELTRDGPVLITENDADKIYLEQTLKVQVYYMSRCEGPLPTRELKTEGPLLKGAWEYKIVLPDHGMRPRVLHCKHGVYPEEGGCRGAGINS